MEWPTESVLPSLGRHALCRSPRCVPAQIRPWPLPVVAEAIHARIRGVGVGHHAKLIDFRLLVALTHQEHDLPRFPSRFGDGHAVYDAFGKGVEVSQNGCPGRCVTCRCRALEVRADRELSQFLGPPVKQGRAGDHGDGGGFGARRGVGV